MCATSTFYPKNPLSCLRKSLELSTVIRRAPNDTISDPDELFYVPVTGFIGSDSFSYCAADATGLSNVATVSLQVADPANYPMPIGVSDPGFGIDESAPADPAAWPGGETAGYYFVGSSQSGFWLLDNRCDENAGDCVQLTNNNTTSDVFVGRLVAHSEGENCVDIKDFNRVVVSESDCWDQRRVVYGNSGGSTPSVYSGLSAFRNALSLSQSSVEGVVAAFKDESLYDYRLDAGSSLIDSVPAGFLSAQPILTDLVNDLGINLTDIAGTPRPQGVDYEAGAYSYKP